MEQRIGPNIQPLQGAAVDPAFVPGITGPRPVEPKDVKPEDTEPAEAAEEAAEETAEETAVAEEGASEAEEAASEETASEEQPGDEPAGEEPAEAPEGPVFEASDRRAKIVADHSGVRLSLDDQKAEFRWDEIGAVETESPRFGKRFTITVHTPDRRWYPIEIEATARASFKEWEAQLDEVLDAYFEEGSAP
ncbi:hypothetical protein [Streptomyces sp. 2A115]|uniref:hypothetical protein n=1 Tax=Streptomyces sp. 2A115 TaxID=3457439 RepID=UPI003FD0C339